MNKINIKVFEDSNIRQIRIDNQEWIAGIDVAAALGYSNPARDYSTIIGRNPERFVNYTCTRKMMTQDKNGVKQNRKISFLNLKGVIAFCSLSNMPNAIPFQRWADNVLEYEIKSKKQRKQIYGPMTEKSITARNFQTSEWHRHGAKGKDYSDLTLEEYSQLGFEDWKRKEHLSGDELLKLIASNALNTLSLKKHNDAIGKHGIQKSIHQSTKIVHDIENKKITG